MKLTEKALLAALLALAPVALCAQEPPLGAEFPIDSNSAASPENATVASDQSGDFAVVWDTFGQDGDSQGVFGQRYDYLGAKVGSEFQVNTYTTGNQYGAKIATNQSGNFVVVWDSYGQDGSKSGVFGQRFGVKSFPLPPKFVKLGNEFQVNTVTSLVQFEPSVAMDAAGNFVVIWYGDGDFGGGGVWSPVGQRYDSSGNKLGGTFAITNDTSTDPAPVGLTMAGKGDFVVVWAKYNAGSGSDVFGQRFDSSGAKVGSEFQVNTYTTGQQKDPRVAMDGRGNFVVVWSSYQLGPPSVISGQWFNSSREKVGPEFQVDAYTTGADLLPSVALEEGGNFVVVWEGNRDGNSAILGQEFDRAGNRIGAEFVVGASTAYQFAGPRIAYDGSGFVVVYEKFEHPSSLGVFGRRVDRIPVGISVDSRSANGTVSDANGVLEPGETVLVAPLWTNHSTLNFGDFAGTASSFSGPPGPTYGIPDSSADYGAMPSRALGLCDDGTPDACYHVSVAGPRPATHWDTTLEEDVSFGGGHLWTLHVGDSFTDVPRSQPFYKKIETVLHAGITAGCGGTLYCPANAVTRDQMAIFIAKALAGGGQFVPTTGSVSGISFGSSYNCSAGGNSLFTDVTPTDAFCRHVHYLANQNVTLGCGSNMYCPGQTVTRDAMASFIAKAIVAPGGGAAVPLSYGPDPNTGLSYSCDAASPNIHFTDVPVSNAFCKHIHFLWARGVVSGCTATQYCPTLPVNRDAMAKFLANGFGLQLYEP